jgi:hypothetical protein
VRGDGDDAVTEGLEDAHELVELIEIDRLEMNPIIIAEVDPALPEYWEEPEGIQGPNRSLYPWLGDDEGGESFGENGLCLSYCRFVRVLLWGVACLVFHENPALSCD